MIHIIKLNQISKIEIREQSHAKYLYIQTDYGIEHSIYDDIASIYNLLSGNIGRNSGLFIDTDTNTVKLI